MSQSQSAERRKSYRLPFNAKVVCSIKPDNQVYPGTINDISADGFSMKADSCPSIGSKCDIEIIIEGTNSRLKIDQLSGDVVREISDGVSVVFEKKLEWLSLVPIYFKKLRDNV